MRERLQKFSLSLHPDNTRLIEIGRFAAANRMRCGRGKPETFNFLGFTFIAGKSRRGKFIFILKRLLFFALKPARFRPNCRCSICRPVACSEP